jgi:ribosomal-protein-alanine N-acetyltransferase
MTIFNPFPLLKTKNLSLRRMTPEDTEDIYQMRKDPRMIEFTDSKLDASREETNSYIEKMNRGVDEGKWIIWAIVHKSSKKVIGSISIWNMDSEQKSAELGYGIIPEYQNKGFMKEALASVVEYGFEVMNLNTLDAYTEEKNINSIKLLETCKFVEVNRVDDEGYYSEKTYHMIVYQMKNSWG